MKELKNKEDIEYIEKELFKNDKLEILHKISLILSYIMFSLTLLLLAIQIIAQELTRDALGIYAILLIFSTFSIRRNNIKLEENRYKLIMQFIEEVKKSQ